MEKQRRLYRSEKERLLGGVCGGLAEYFRTDPVLVRVIFVILSILLGVLLGIVAYIVLWIIVPRASSAELSAKEAVKENIEELKETATEAGKKVKEHIDEIKGNPTEAGKEAKETARRGLAYFLGFVLIVLGVVLFLVNFGFSWWFGFANAWPVVFIILGVLLLVYTGRD
jgi:phage shock protein C